MTKSSQMAPLYNINIPKEVFNPAFYPFLWKIFNYEVYWGGRGGGKSVDLGMKLPIQLTTMEGRNLVAMRKQATDCRNSCFAEIYKGIYKFQLQDIWDIRENPDMRMYNKITQSEIIFTGMDKAENVKSLTFKHGSATDLWYEELTEETNEDNLITLDNSIRAYGKKCRLILSFNPPLNTYWIFHWLKTVLNYEPLHLDTPYIKTLDDYGTDCLVLHTTYKDNKWNFFIKPDGTADYSKPNQYASKLERLKFIDPYRYRVDCLGLPGTAGQSVFDSNKVAKRYTELREIYDKQPPAKYNFSYVCDDKGLPIPETIHGGESLVGEATIYKQPDPKHPYVASLDPSVEGADYTFMQIFNNITDEQVATFRSQKATHDCMVQVYGLLKMYNDALVAVEVNITDYPMEMLKQWGYMNFYQRDKRADERHDGMEQKYGFRTTVGNRQSILDNLIKWSVNNMDKIYDMDTLNEMLTFTRQTKANKGMFMAAEAGAHDDAIMALAILLKAKEQQVAYEVAEIKKVEGYWTRGELNLAVADGRVDEKAAREYILNREAEQRFKNNPLRRRSRYAR